MQSCSTLYYFQQILDTFIEFDFTKRNINIQTAEGFFYPSLSFKKARTFYLRSKLVALN